MKNYIPGLVLAFVSCGCGAAPEDVGGYDMIGNLGQPIFMPTGYGAENSTAGLQCSPPWSGGICLVPDSKVFLYKLFASTCSSWWQARVVGAENYFKPFVNGLGDDWAYSGEIQGLYSISIKCEATDGLASFTPSASGADNHATEFGTLMQWKTGAMRIDAAEVEAQPGWSSKTEAEKIRAAENVIKHEYGHSVGFGHGGTGIMRPGETWTNSERYGSTMTFGTTERNMLRCYNEDSGSDDDC